MGIKAENRTDSAPDPFAGLSNFTRFEGQGTLPAESEPGAYRIRGEFSGASGSSYLDDFYFFTEQGCAVRTKALTLVDLASGKADFQSAKLENARWAASESSTDAYSIDIGRTHSCAILVNLRPEDPRIDELSAFAAKTFEEILSSGSGDPTFDTLDRLEKKCVESAIEYRTL